MANPKDSLLPILGTLYPWRRTILRVTAAAFVLSILGSLLMKNYYQGKTIFYAASQDLFKPDKVFGNSQQEMYYYGSGEDIDRILTVANSNEVLDFVIDSFNLWDVYKIRPGSPKARFNMRKSFKENYNILLTKQDALELTVEDRDPERAAAMANAAREKINVLVRNIIKNSQRDLVNSYTKSIAKKEQILQQMLDSLVKFRGRTGIYDPQGQTELLATRVTEVTNSVERDKAALAAFEDQRVTGKLADTLKVIRARIKGAERELAILNGDDATSNYSLKNFNLSKSKIQSMEANYNRSSEQIGYDKEKMKIYDSAIDINVSAVHVIEQAEAPLNKYRPKRSVIVLACTFAAFLFSLAYVLVIESYRQTDWRGIMREKNPV